MKLYATTTSERASKGQGGNKFLELRANVGDQHNSRRTMYARLDAKDEGYYLIIELSNPDGTTTRIERLITTT